KGFFSSVIFKAIIHSDSSLLMGKELLFLAIYPFRILQLHTANTTRIGTLELHVPRTRDGKFSPTIFERYQRSEKALIAAMIEMV
ncbi:transposase, partial [Enterococcus faecium]|uniref:transposase n=1 Tax=Enterococcus faecium TaxID=1352 RepID=UPI00292E80E5